MMVGHVQMGWKSVCGSPPVLRGFNGQQWPTGQYISLVILIITCFFLAQISRATVKKTRIGHIHSWRVRELWFYLESKHDKKQRTFSFW